MNENPWFQWLNEESDDEFKYDGKSKYKIEEW